MARTPSIPMDNPFRGSFEAEGSVLQYLAVIPGSDDHQVDLVPNTGYDAGDGGIISGIPQDDALDGEWVPVVYFGTTWAVAQAAVTRDDPLEAIYSATVAENGRMKTMAGVYPAGDMVSAIALEDAATGERFKIFLIRHIQVAIT